MGHGNTSCDPHLHQSHQATNAPLPHAKRLPHGRLRSNDETGYVRISTMTCRASIGRAYAVPKLACAAHRACRLWNTRNTSLRLRRCRSPGLLDTSVQVGLFLSCVGCHSSAEVFFLLNFFVVEGGCEVLGLQDLADLYVGFAFVGVGASLDPLDRLFERLNLPEPEAGDEFLAFGEGAVNDGAVLAGEVDAGAFGRGVKTVVA